MENEKLKNALMNDEELDLVAGGRGYVYYSQTADGKFNVVSFNKPLTGAQISEVLKTGALPKGFKGNTASLRVMQGVRANSFDKLKEKLNKQYKGCEFHEI